MAEPTLEKFATQVKPETLATLRSLAKIEGRQLQALVEEALSDLIEKRKGGRPRAQGNRLKLAGIPKFIFR